MPGATGARPLSDATMGRISGLGGIAAWFATVLPATDPVVSGSLSPLWWVLVVAYLLDFVVVSQLDPPGWARPGSILLVALFVGAVFAAPAYSTTGILAVPGVVCVAWVFGMRVTLAVAVGQALVLGVAGRTVTPSPLGWLWWSLACGGLELFAVVMVEATLREARARTELAAAQARLAETTREAERLRIARDLHDQVGHQLTALALNLEAATLLAAGTPAAEPVEACRLLAKETLADVRTVVSQMRGDAGTPGAQAPPYDGAQLAGRLRDLGATVPAPQVITSVVGVGSLRPATYDVLLRAAQEIVTNAARHSGASELRIDVYAEDGEIVLRGVDDGPGPGGAPERGGDAPRAGIVEGNGLRGMRERVGALGGVVTIAGPPGGGFRVVARLPEDAS